LRREDTANDCPTPRLANIIRDEYQYEIKEKKNKSASRRNREDKEKRAGRTIGDGRGDGE
jgi:hypothetical protein